MKKRLIEILIVGIVASSFSILIYSLRQKEPIKSEEPLIAKTGINAVLYDFDLSNAITYEDNDVTVVSAPEQKVGYATTTVNIRSLPSTESEIYGILNQNDKIRYITTNRDGQDWCVIELKDEELGYVRADYVSDSKVKVTPKTETVIYEYSGEKLTPSKGVNNGPSGFETYYNLDMSNCVRYMHDLGFEGDYWVRNDGAKMFGNEIMIATDTNKFPKGTKLQTSLGMGIVSDHCERSVNEGRIIIDLAVTW